MNPLPPVIASSRPVFGQSLIDKRSDLQLLEDFASQDEIERWMLSLAERKIDTIATLSDARIFAAAKALRAQHEININLIPIIPNVMGLVREATEYGMMGAGFRLLGRLGLLNAALIGKSKVVADFKGLTAAEVADINARPMVVSARDVI